ncbi:homeodomain-interacting protein kinase 4 [Struthio camelus]|uniref:homeodomain-interacting protein kinase 4 n=1 Tax=Struthio camelus TaxID=8801 RepID=UPI003603D0F0
MVTLESGTECYDVVDTLGKGTFGEVAKSWRRSTGEMVAIKILKNDGHRSRIIKNELKLLQAMGAVDAEESHIVRFLESFHDGTKCYLVFELLEQNLFDFQKENNFSPLPVRHIRTITVQVLKALAKLKELSIIHADLKPENIMLVDHARYPFRVKVIDFGSASIFSEVRYIKEPYIQSRFYRAPEILLGLPFCEKVDVWSLGCVMAELHLGWPLYPGSSEYDQVRYICETQGLPRGGLLHAARKAHRFFRRAPHPDAAGPWQLKSLAEHLAETREKPVERRKYVLASLDQMETVSGQRMIYPDSEALAERCDLRGMVELVKRMLTWDSHERITPSAALKHPFVSLQQLKASYEPTHYYQLCRQGLQASRKEAGAAEAFPDGEEGAFLPPPPQEEPAQPVPAGRCSVQRAIAQMDDLSLAEVAPGDESRCGAGPPPPPAPAPIPTHYGSWHRAARHRRHPRRPKPDPILGNLIVLGPRSPGVAGGGWERQGQRGGSEEQSLPGRPPPSPHAKVLCVPSVLWVTDAPSPWVLLVPQVLWDTERSRSPGALGLQVLWVTDTPGPQVLLVPHVLQVTDALGPQVLLVPYVLQITDTPGPQVLLVPCMLQVTDTPGPQVLLVPYVLQVTDTPGPQVLQVTDALGPQVLLVPYVLQVTDALGPQVLEVPTKTQSVGCGSHPVGLAAGPIQPPGCAPGAAGCPPFPGPAAPLTAPCFSRLQRALAEWCTPEPQRPVAGAWLGSEDWLREQGSEHPAGHGGLHHAQSRHPRYLQHVAGHH